MVKWLLLFYMRVSRGTNENYNNFNTKKSNFFSNFAFLIHLLKNENKILGTY